MRLRLLIFALLSVSLYADSAAVERAWKLAANGDRRGAEETLRTLLRSEPRNGEAHLLLGSLLAEDGEAGAAIAELRTATQLQPRSAVAFNTLGETQRRFGEGAAAREAFAKAVTLDGRNGVAQSNLGAMLLEAGEQDGAAAHFDQAITTLKDRRDAAEAHYLRAKISTAKGEAGAAKTHLEKAVKLQPDLAEAWSDLGVARRGSNAVESAVDAFLKAVALEPSNAVAQYRLGSEYLREEKAAEALPPLQAALRLNGDDQSVLNALITTYRRLGRDNEAAATKRQLTEVLHRRDVASQNALAALRHNNEGAALEKEGKLAEARERYRQAVELNPEHAGMRVNYGVALLRSGMWREGLEQLHAAQERDPHNVQIETALKDAVAQAPKDALPEWASQRDR